MEELEIWKDIPDFEGLYMASNMGNIFSIRSDKKLSIRCNTPYQNVTLCKDRICKTYQAHRMIALAFIPNPDNKPEINHINGIKHDNRIENLELATRSENNAHAYREGLNKTTEKHNFRSNHPSKGKFGKDHYNSKQVDQYSKDGILIKSWGNARCVQRELGLNNGMISKCCHGKKESCGGYVWKFANNEANLLTANRSDEIY